MTTEPKWRIERFHRQLGKNVSIRTDYQRDKDRILHCSAFRRLATITQVVSPDQSPILHNRLTHTLKVGQIGRRLAERLVYKQGRLVEKLGGISPDVVEAAGLAHDLGHPPFGHIAETALRQAATDHAEGCLPDSFEGNAQSFRIVSTLAIKEEEFDGLNLTRATCNAILKYPWTHDATHEKKSHKWGAYDAEGAVFEWARKPLDEHLGFALGDRRTLEAELMDYADDIAYSVYDFEDFSKSGKIPVYHLFEGPPKRLSVEAGRFLERLELRRSKQKTSNHFHREAYVAAFLRLKSAFPRFDRYVGSRNQRAFYRDMTSELVGRFMNAATVKTPTNAKESMLQIPSDKLIEVDLLKELTFSYVVFDPSLVNQQTGYREIVTTLFRRFSKDVKAGCCEGLPPWCQEALERVKPEDQYAHYRLVMDFVASLTESQAVQLYQRITGVSAGSLFPSAF